MSLCDPMDCSCQVHPLMRFSWQEYWSGLHALLQGIFLMQGLHPCLMSPALAGGFLTTSASWEALCVHWWIQFAEWEIVVACYFLYLSSFILSFLPRYLHFSTLSLFFFPLLLNQSPTIAFSDFGIIYILALKNE